MLCALVSLKRCMQGDVACACLRGVSVITSFIKTQLDQSDRTQLPSALTSSHTVPFMHRAGDLGLTVG